ncbi:unnamed protein product [Closterium sp. NIES-64]|nr:unnamed protein product [Closterium sp. NIES-64]
MNMSSLTQPGSLVPLLLLLLAGYMLPEVAEGWKFGALGKHSHRQNQQQENHQHWKYGSRCQMQWKGVQEEGRAQL